MNRVGPLCWLVGFTAWVTALFPLRVAGWLLGLYATHASLPVTLHVAGPSLAWAAAYVCAGVLYLLIPALRPFVLAAAVVLAVSGFLKLPSYVHALSTLNLWHNVMAEGLWEACGCAAIACAAAAHLLAERFRPSVRNAR